MTDGKIAIFLMILKTFFLLSIFVLTSLSGYFCLVDLLDDLAYSGEYLLICLNLLGGIYEQYVSTLDLKVMFLPAPAFPDAPFQQISLDCAFEQFLWDGHHDTVAVTAVSCKIYTTEPRHVSMTTLGK